MAKDNACRWPGRWGRKEIEENFDGFSQESHHNLVGCTSLVTVFTRVVLRVAGLHGRSEAKGIFLLRVERGFLNFSKRS